MNDRGQPSEAGRDGPIPVPLRGSALLADPLLNKGPCFTREERAALGLEGLLPPGVSTLEEAEHRAYENYLSAGDDIHRYVFLAALQDRDETLFHRLVLKHLEEMAPIVYTPTVGVACERYSHLYRRSRGVYVSCEDRGRVERVLAGVADRPYRIAVVTDNQAILGLGDLGVGGMGIPIGKLALYTAGAGLHPAACLPLDLDVGTDNPALLKDPLYLGVRRPRLKGTEYDDLVDELVDALVKVFPGLLVQWEDFANHNAFRILDRTRHRLPCFNDDIQGTGAVVLAGLRTALDQVGRRLDDERVVFFGLGAAGGGCALALRAALAEAGVPDGEFDRHALCLNSKGLLLSDQPGLGSPHLELAASPARVSGWPEPSGPRGYSLHDVVRGFRPTVLVGTSGQAGAFDEEVVRTMAEGCPRPIVFPLSNPTRHAEATPADILRWTRGAAVVGTGSPFPPVEQAGTTHHIGQGNNVLVFPGVGLGALAVSARWLPDACFLAASGAVYEATPRSTRPGAPIYPPLSRLRAVSAAVARAVGRSLVEAGAAPPMTGAEIDARVDALVWEPVYRPYRAG